MPPSNQQPGSQQPQQPAPAGFPVAAQPQFQPQPAQQPIASGAVAQNNSAPVPEKKMSNNNEITIRAALIPLESNLSDSIFLAQSGRPSHLFFFERL